MTLKLDFCRTLCFLSLGAVLSAQPLNADEPAHIMPVNVCFDFSCKNEQRVGLTEADWNQIAGMFHMNGGAEEERQRIKEAIAEMETLVGKYAPTFRDVGMNRPPDDDEPGNQSGQMDCIDESINTTTYLKLFESQGLLKFHRVLERAYRSSFLTQHWAGQIMEISNGQRYVIDSWFRDNGELPFLVKGEVWHDLSLF